MAFTNPQDAFDAMIEKFNPQAAEGIDAAFQRTLIGDRGGTWHINVQNGRAALANDKHPAPKVAQTSSVDLFLSMVNFEINGMQAFMSGKLKMTGDMMLAQKIYDIFPL
ncbi:MAG: SCP2 sterol-binding domain-containing protein [Pseudomonadota bacterium]